MTSDTVGARRGEEDSFGVLSSAGSDFSEEAVSFAASFFPFFAARLVLCFCFRFFSFSMRFFASTSIFCLKRSRSSSRSLAPSHYADVMIRTLRLDHGESGSNFLLGLLFHLFSSLLDFLRHCSLLFRIELLPSSLL